MEALYNIFVESVKETVVKLRDLAALKPDFDLKTVQKNALGEFVSNTSSQVASIPTTFAASSKKNPATATPDYLMAPIPKPLFKVQGHFQPIALNNNINPGFEGIPLRSYK